jgi:hypothetical protein
VSFLRQREHFYYWAQDVISREGANYELAGFDFDGGPCALTPFPHEGQFWILSCCGKVLLDEEIQLNHVNRRGWIVLVREVNFQFPCLITSDPKLTSSFAGCVSVASNDASVDLASAIGSGMPLVGRDWLGVVQASDAGFLLTAFSESDSLELPTKAYYPDWASSESIEDQSDAFVLRLSRPAEPSDAADSR